jgi:hypothetical protein
LKFAKLPKLEEELQKLEAASEVVGDVDTGSRMLRDEVTAGKCYEFSKLLLYCPFRNGDGCILTNFLQTTLQM